MQTPNSQAPVHNVGILLLVVLLLLLVTVPTFVLLQIPWGRLFDPPGGPPGASQFPNFQPTAPRSMPPVHSAAFEWMIGHLNCHSPHAKAV
eukprot:1990097-Rhodomonas_salina.1